MTGFFLVGCQGLIATFLSRSQARARSCGMLWCLCPRQYCFVGPCVRLQSMHAGGPVHMGLQLQLHTVTMHKEMGYEFPLYKVGR